MKRLFLSIFLWTSLLLSAAEVSTRVSSNTVSAQEGFHYIIEIVSQDSQRGTPNVQLPVFPDDFPFQVVGPQGPQTSSSTMVQSINGRTTTTVTRTFRYVYRLTPKRAGTLQIPAMAMQVDGKACQTTPIAIKVMAQGSQEDPAYGIVLRQSCEPENAAPGMPVRLRYTFTFPTEKVYAAPRFEPPGDFLSRNFRLPEDFNWLNNWRSTQRNINGIPCQVMTLEVEIVPKKAGEIILPPFCMTVDVVDANARTQQRRRSPFDFFDDDPFFRRTPTRQLNLLSNEVTLRVSEPPEEGRPADFSGIIGKVKADVRLSHTDVSVGDPIVAEITLSGSGITPETRLPSLKENAAVAEQFSVSGDDEPPRRDETTGGLVFQATLRAKKAGDIAFPALKIPYFDPETQTYGTATTESIHVTAREVKQVTLQDATIAGEAPVTAAATAPTATVQPEKNTQGLAADYSAREVLEDTTADTSHSLRKRLLLFAALPAALWLLCLIVRLVPVLRLASPEARARSAALRELRRAAKAYRPNDSAAADALYHALHEYGIRRFSLPGGTFGPADLEDKGLSRKQMATWCEALETVEAIRFAGSAPDSNALRELIRKVEA